jgi:hypothetical protein
MCYTLEWDAGGSPSQAMDVQEMGVDGQDNRETGGSSTDRIFFMKYPLNVFLTTLVHNLSPTTAGHNDHRFFSCFPLIC